MNFVDLSGCTRVLSGSGTVQLVWLERSGAGLSHSNTSIHFNLTAAMGYAANTVDATWRWLFVISLAIIPQTISASNHNTV